MSFAIRSLLLLILSIAIATQASAQTAAETTENMAYFKRMSKAMTFSCDTISVFDHDGENFMPEGKAREVKIDPSHCDQSLAFITGEKILSQLWVEFEYQNRQGSKIIAEQTEAEKQEVQNQNDRLRKQSIEEVRKQTKPLVDFCLQAAATQKPNENRMCYFGGPLETSSAAFKDSFEAMLQNTLPPNWSLCTKDPIAPNSKVEHEFERIRSAAKSPVHWREVQKSLKMDGYICDSKGKCQKWLLGVWLPSETAAETSPQVPKNSPFVVIRILEFYRGDNHTIGPLSRGCSFDFKDSSRFCSDAKHKINVPSGICQATEDWHTWYGMQVMLNMEKL